MLCIKAHSCKIYPYERQRSDDCNQREGGVRVSLSNSHALSFALTSERAYESRSAARRFLPSSLNPSTFSTRTELICPTIAIGRTACGPGRPANRPAPEFPALDFPVPASGAHPSPGRRARPWPSVCKCEACVWCSLNGDVSLLHTQWRNDDLEVTS